jgi:hypothetical protein
VPSVNRQADDLARSCQNPSLTKELTAVAPGVREYEWYARLAGEVRPITVWVGPVRQEPEQYSPLK